MYLSPEDGKWKVKKNKAQFEIHFHSSVECFSENVPSSILKMKEKVLLGRYKEILLFVGLQASGASKSGRLL